MIWLLNLYLFKRDNLEIFIKLLTEYSKYQIPSKK